jgi:hypothetical protein
VVVIRRARRAAGFLVPFRRPLAEWSERTAAACVPLEFDDDGPRWMYARERACSSSAVVARARALGAYVRMLDEAGVGERQSRSAEFPLGAADQTTVLAEAVEVGVGDDAWSSGTCGVSLRGQRSSS